jgi:hypothetical protein
MGQAIGGAVSPDGLLADLARLREALLKAAEQG